MTKNTLTTHITSVLIVLAMAISAALAFTVAQPQTAHAQQSCPALPTDRGTLSYTVQATSSEQRSYWVWARVKSDDGNPSFLLNARNDQDAICGENMNGSGSGWIWVRSSTTIDWAGSDLIIEAAGNKDAVGLDCILLHSSSSFTPTTKEDCALTASDTQNPTVNISSPTSGATVSDTITIEANASDNDSIVSVVFSIDGTDVDTQQNAPYSFPYDTSNLANGSHTLRAVATDPSGNTSEDSLSFNVNNVAPNNAPNTVTSLSGNATGESTTAISWNAATDPDGDAVEYIVERQTGSATFAPVATVTTTSYDDSGLQPSTTYGYRVITAESDTQEGLQSNPSSSISVTTQAQCRRVTLIEVSTVISNFLNGTFNTSSELFDDDNNNAIDIIEVSGAISDYLNGRCL